MRYGDGCGLAGDNLSHARGLVTICRGAGVWLSDLVSQTKVTTVTVTWIFRRACSGLLLENLSIPNAAKPDIRASNRRSSNRGARVHHSHIYRCCGMFYLRFLALATE